MEVNQHSRILQGDDNKLPDKANSEYPEAPESIANGGSVESNGDGTHVSPPETEKSAPATPGSGIRERRQSDMTYLQGLRFWAASALLAIMFFLVSMEISVVTTALVAIVDDLGGFESVSWVLSSYLLGYVSVVILVAKFSDIFGRKQLLVVCILIFTILSAGCGAAQSMTQLIILRAFQGIGGGGCFAMNVIFMIEIVPPHKYGQFVANMGIPAALALGSGPIIGGAISSTTTWRWVFLINVPIGAAALTLALTAIPNGFPFHGSEHYKHSIKDLMTTTTLKRVDLLGSMLVVLASLSLTAGFEEAGSQFPWKSAYVISLLVVSAIFWIALLVWERYVTLSASIREPILPWRFVTDHVLCGIILGSLLLGGPMTVTVFQLPQRFQLVNALSGLDAGVRLVPFAGGVPLGAIIGSSVAGRFRVAPIFIAIGGSILQIVGFALLGTLPPTSQITPETYGFQIVGGVGCGATYQSLYLLVPLATGPRDHAVGMGAVTQFRLMGGAIVLAISTSIFNSYVLPSLADLGISSSQISENMAQLITTSPELGETLRPILSEGYNRQMLVLCASAVAEVLATLLIWKKKQLMLPKKELELQSEHLTSS